MKKIIAFLFIAVMLNACYEDYIRDFEYDGVYFPYQVDVRTFVVGEGMKFNFGVTLGGVRDNDYDRTVQYQLDNSLITPFTLETMKGSSAAYIKSSVQGIDELNVLPTSYYSLSDNNIMVIKKGEYNGIVTVKADSAAFLADPSTIAPGYAIAMRIISADADTIIKSKDYEVIALKYENMLFGNYWHGGVTVEKDASGTVVNETAYYTTIPSPEAKIWSLSTVDPMALTVNGVSNESSTGKPEMRLDLSGGTITVSSVEGANYEVMPDGASTYNQAKLLQNRKIFLKYKYQNASGNWCYANDTLTFRNRIRDGVNEWQDENPANYE